MDITDADKELKARVPAFKKELPVMVTDAAKPLAAVM